MKTIPLLLVLLSVCLFGCQQEETTPVEHQPMGMVEAPAMPSPSIEITVKQGDSPDANRLTKREYYRRGMTKNAENAKSGFDFRMGDMASSNDDGNQSVADLQGKLATSWGFIIFGLGLAILGGLLWGLLNKMKVGASLIGIGIVAGLAPVIWETIWPFVVGGGLLAGVGAVIWMMMDERQKNKVHEASTRNLQGIVDYYDEATSDFNIGKLFNDNDPRAGGALAHVKMGRPGLSQEEINQANKFKSDARKAGKPT